MPVCVNKECIDSGCFLEILNFMDELLNLWINFENKEGQTVPEGPGPGES